MAQLETKRIDSEHQPARMDQLTSDRNLLRGPLYLVNRERIFWAIVWKTSFNSPELAAMA